MADRPHAGGYRRTDRIYRRQELPVGKTASTLHRGRQPAESLDGPFDPVRPVAGVEADAVAVLLLGREGGPRSDGDACRECLLVEDERIHVLREFDPEDKAAGRAGNPGRGWEMAPDRLGHEACLARVDPPQTPE